MTNKHKNYCKSLLMYLLAMAILFAQPVSAQKSESDTASLTPGEMIKGQFEEQISKYLGVPVHASDISLGYSSIEVTGVKIGKIGDKKKGYAEIKKISAVCNFMSLLGGTLDIQELSVDSLSCTLNRSLLSKLGAKKSIKDLKQPLASSFPFNSFKGTNFRFHILASRKGKTLHITLPKLQISKKASDNTGSLAIEGRVSDGSPSINFQGNLKIVSFSPFMTSGSLSIKEVTAASYLSVIKNITGNKLAGIAVTKGTIKASIKVSAEKPDSNKIKAWLESKNLSFSKDGIDVKNLTMQTSVITRFPKTGKGADSIANVDFSNGSIYASNKIGRPITNLNGAIKLTLAKCKIEKMAMNWGKSSISLNGNIKNYKTYNTNLDFNINKLNLTDAGAYFLKNSPYKIVGIGKSKGKISGPFAKLSITGNVDIPKASFSISMSKPKKDTYVFPITKISSLFVYSNGIINAKKVSGKVFGGHVYGNCNVMLRKKPISFNFKANGKNLRTESFLSSNSTQKNVVSAPFNLTLKGRGNWNGLNTWNGNGSMTMTEGKYSAPPVVTPILSMLNLKEFASGNINKASGNFNMVNGKLNTSDLYCLTDAGKVFYKGSIGLDTSLSGKMNLIFAKSAVSKSRILQEISRDGNTVSIPTKVRGSLLAPSFPGFKTENLLKLGLQRKGEKMLQNIIFGKQKGTQNDGNSNSNQKIDGNIFKGLEQIFKRKKSKSPAPTTPITPVRSEPTKKMKKKKSKNIIQKSLEKELNKLFKF